MRKARAVVCHPTTRYQGTHAEVYRPGNHAIHSAKRQGVDQAQRKTTTKRQSNPEKKKF